MMSADLMKHPIDAQNNGLILPGLDGVVTDESHTVFAVGDEVDPANSARSASLQEA